MKRIFGLGLFGIIGMTAPALSLAAPASGGAVLQVAAADNVQPQTVSATGVVKQIEPEQGKVKIAHDPIPALGWPAMTMFFRVKDKTVLEGIAAGDSVRFEMDKDAKGLVIMRMVKVSK